MIKKRLKNSPRHMWTKEQDMLLLRIIEGNQSIIWNDIADQFNKLDRENLKNAKQCRERYKNYLKQNCVKHTWSKSEKLLFVVLHNYYQNKWREIAKFFPNCNDIAVKNYFYTYIRKVLKKIQCRLYDLNIGNKPRKAVHYFYVVNMICKKYISHFNNEISLTQGKDMTIANIIKMKKLDDEKMIKCRNGIIDSLKKQIGRAHV